jgi:hypothetical protein
MKVEIEFNNQDIIDCLITALEGGSNYWYWLPDTSFKKHYEGTELSLSEKVTKSVLENNEVVPVQDLETREHLGDISQATIARGIQLFIENGGEFTPDMDAGEADTLFQYIVMGELVFG